MNEYIKNMRKLIGHAPIMICGVSVIVVNEKGQLLLQKRRDNGCWGYHGGCMEIYETTEETAKRELLEETGLVADKLSSSVFFQDQTCTIHIRMKMKYLLLILSTYATNGLERSIETPMKYRNYAFLNRMICLII